MIKDRSEAVMRSKWFMPAFCLALGAVVLAAGWLGGQLGVGLFGLVVMAAFGLVILLLTRHNETIRGLTTGRDERFAQIDLKATAPPSRCSADGAAGRLRAPRLRHHGRDAHLPTGADLVPEGAALPWGWFGSLSELWRRSWGAGRARPR